MNENQRRLNARQVANLVVDTSPYLSCDDCFIRIDEYVERRIVDPGHEDVAMKVHLAGCGACAEEADALSALLARDVD